MDRMSIMTDGGTSGTDTPDPRRPEDFAPKDPFVNQYGQGQSKQFRVTKEVNFPQLEAEIEEALGEDIELAMARFDSTADAGEQNPTVLFVYTSADEKKVREAIDAHEPDHAYVAAQQQSDTEDLLRKIEAGDTLSPVEITQALQVLLQR